MGNYLSSPRTAKETRIGNGNGFEYGVSCMQGWRRTMEDEHIAQTNIETLNGGSIFAVFDGHGGKLVANESAHRLVDCLVKVEPNFNDPEEIGDAFGHAFISLDAELRNLDPIDCGDDHSGCTAIAAFVSDTHIIVANTGDSRSVLASDATSVIPLSSDHKPSNPRERRRIEYAGGIVSKNRVNGDLAVSRALGDFHYKERFDLAPEDQQVSPEPDIKVQSRSKDNEFIIMACDGVWDVMSNETACEYVRFLMATGETDLGLICEEMLDHCLELGRDNMSIIIVKFSGAKIGYGDGVAGIRAIRKKLEEEQQVQRGNDREFVSGVRSPLTSVAQ